jgi:Flp pilus assembly protein TadG
MRSIFRFIPRAIGSLLSAWRGWRSHVHGGIAVTFSLTIPILLSVVGVATDYAMLTKVRTELQDAADAAALAGAREIPLSMSNAKQVESAVRSFASYQLTQNSAATLADLARIKVTLAVEVVEDFTAVKVTISEEWSPFFMHFVSKSVTPVTVRSQARYVGRNNVCILGLSTSTTAVYLDKGSRLTGNNCGVFSNSVKSAGLQIDIAAIAKASIFCSAGGASVSGAAIVNPTPITDCPPIQDPLLKRTAPGFGSCDHNKLVINGGSKTLDPGVYCGGLVISGMSKVTLNPGTYIIKDGGLIVSGKATATGKGVGFYITGAAAPTFFSALSHISLSAATDGPMAGLLIFEDRNLANKLRHRISSNDARMLLGTIYLPVGSLVIDSILPVADQSAYTAIVAQSIELNLGPNLVLNANYDMTDVPVPAGIAGSSQVVLSN